MESGVPESRWRVVKVSGGVEVYSQEKVADAIFLAAQDVGGTDERLAKNLGRRVTDYLEQQYGRQKEISTRDIGDAVERILMEQHHIKTAKAYILNRDRKREVYEAKIRLGVKDDVGMGLNALLIMKNKYLRRQEPRKDRRGGDGEYETPLEAFERVAKAAAQAEPNKKLSALWGQKFLEVMLSRRFLPGGRTLANAGTVNNQLANCFVMPFPDNIEGIFEIVKESSILKKNGGAVGFSFSKIRPKGDLIRTTSGRAAGPVALMGILDHASQIFVQAGGRRSGNMVTLSVSHPDIFEFIVCKESGMNFPNINYSLEVTNAFMKAVEADAGWQLINPHSGVIVEQVSARSILEQAARLAWKRGDPGIIFIDEINRGNPTPKVGTLETVNLCGEQPLLPYEACNLGSINLARHLVAKKGKQSTMGDYTVDWKLLDETVRIGVRFLDNVISICHYPLPELDKMVKANRKIGLGAMGWADMLVRLGTAYNSIEARRLAEKVMQRIQRIAWDESEKLGKEKGSFPNFKGSIWEKRGFKRFRNATTTTIAPTGSLSMVGECSGGIEPLFALAYYRKAMGDYELPEVNNDLVIALKRSNGVYSAGLMDRIARSGSIQDVDEIPGKIREVFVTAMEIVPEDHVLMQAAFQKYTDNAVSKTINMPAGVSVEEVMEAFILAWKTKCKGITVYRDKSREMQVLNTGLAEKKQPSHSGYSAAAHGDTVTTTGRSEGNDTERPIRLSGGVKGTARSAQGGQICPNCGGKVMMIEGCATCQECGWGKCSL